MTTTLPPSPLCFPSLPTLSALSVIISCSLGWAVTRLNCLSALSSYMSLVATHLKSAWDVLLDRALFGHLDLWSTNVRLLAHQELGVRLYPGALGPEGEAVECAICLCKIEPGNEISELGCSHMFHRVCIERWLQSNRLSCPLCRSFVAPWRAVSEVGAEVLFFKFCDFSSNDRGDTWWLR
ncbi:E3 ubiquitin-protein ligase At4g11680-like [Punica granatum]|uniref:RING-type domain-containing protein n=2 Tax=Punica granatum TaxID=22663 RepID=A0A218WSK4_PUNGR|nr:E3 ubiquitin-protein ligase At4g11680-like [Punica granatum]OWM75844.1 hypothetical protein CDL15_Pgr009488 [Punica granatum]PKI53147.1 hypothetical protein CRG98_026452 [Punica granatum]